MAETVDIHALVGAYALDAVDDLERAAFDRHLRDCPSCVTEVAELQATAAWLSEPVAQPAPPHMRDLVLARISQTPQERPTGLKATRQPRGRLRTIVASSVAAAVLAAGVSTGTWVVASQQITAQQESADKIDAVLAAADAKLVRTQIAGGTVTMIVSPARNAAVAVLNGLESPGNDKIYQLWMIEGTKADSVGKGAVGAGSGRFYIEGLKPVFGLSREPKGGSPTPTEVKGTLEIR
jgi:anti-sigma factor RsiW